MATPTDHRAAFAERLRLQLASRFAGAQVQFDPARFALRLTAARVDIAIPLAALEAACEREPQRASSLIADFVRGVEARVNPQEPTEVVSPTRLLWCVRSRRYLDSLARSGELTVREVAADVVAFVAESLPGSIMRGVPRRDAEAAGLDAASLQGAATANTAQRFSRLRQRVATIGRLPADGWRLGGDPLYQGSIVVVPELLAAFAERAGGDILIGLPDRATALLIAASAPGADRFAERVTQEYREAMNPCSTTVLRSDGRCLAVASPPPRRRVPPLMPWLND
ncbi:MAG: DUF1444 domain-containing protein [Candidatus Dormibacteria bacterium]